MHAVPYLNKVQVIHPIQVIPRKNQYILDILAPCILWKEVAGQENSNGQGWLELPVELV